MQVYCVRYLTQVTYMAPKFSAVFPRRFPWHPDICSMTAPLPRTTRADSAEGFTTGLCTSDCVDSRCLEILSDFGALRDTVC